MKLQTRSVELTPVTTGAYEWLYRMATDGDVGWRWRFRGATPSPDTFSRVLWTDVLSQYVVVRRATRQPIGLVQAYSADLSTQNRHCYVAIILSPEYRGLGWPLEGLILFVEHLFETWDFFKLYAEVHSFNLDQFLSARDRILVEEGVLRGHQWRHGVPVDLHIMALYHEAWKSSSHRARLLGHCDLGDPPIRSLSQILVSDFGIPVEQIAPHAQLGDDLGLDSLDVLELQLLLEPRLNGDLEAGDWHTVGSVEAMLLHPPSSPG